MASYADNLAQRKTQFARKLEAEKEKRAKGFQESFFTQFGSSLV